MLYSTCLLALWSVEPLEEHLSPSELSRSSISVTSLSHRCILKLKVKTKDWIVVGVEVEFQGE